MKGKAMFIGKLAEAVGVNVQTVRYYERLGLLSEPVRTESGYRIYGGNALKRLQFIKQAQALGFSLAEIEAVLELSHDGKRPCPSVRKLARAKLAEIDQKLKALLAYRQELAARVKRWDEVPDDLTDAGVCQLIELSKAEKKPLDSIFE
jgi:MerR family mercuric resistance operon transcriptional regulator